VCATKLFPTGRKEILIPWCGISIDPVTKCENCWRSSSCALRRNCCKK